MPFNSETYYANKWAKSAWANIASAKDIKRRAATGDAYDWEIARIPGLVKCARIDMHLSLSQRRMAAMKKRMK